LLASSALIWAGPKWYIEHQSGQQAVSICSEQDPSQLSDNWLRHWHRTTGPGLGIWPIPSLIVSVGAEMNRWLMDLDRANALNETV
jgi:hypothetical protein